MSTLFLAFRAVKRAPASLCNLGDFGFAYRVGFAGFAVDVETVLEFADAALLDA